MIIKIDDDLADKITIQTLLESLKCNQEMSEELLAKDSLENYQAVDLADQLKIIKNLKAVLAYYIPYQEYESIVGEKYPEK